VPPGSPFTSLSQTPHANGGAGLQQLSTSPDESAIITAQSKVTTHVLSEGTPSHQA